MLPDGWENTKLGDVCDVVTGGTPNRSITEYWNGDIPWMSSGEINQRVVRTVAERITSLGMANSNARPLPPGTVMIALNGQGKTRGKVAILEIETACNQSLAGLKADKTRLSPEYLFYSLDAQYRAIRHLTGDDARNGLNLGILRNLNITLPPLDEQQRIAEVMRSVDEAIAANETVLVSSRKLVERLARDVTDRCVATTNMASLGRIITGRTPSPKRAELWGGDLPFVTPGDLVAGNVSVENAARTLVTGSEHGGTVLPANAVLVTCIGSTVGKTAIARQRCVTNQQINAICCAPDIAGFAYLVCVAAHEAIVAHAGKQAVPIINKSTFSKLEVPATSRAEMTEISAMVDAIDNEIAAANSMLDTLCRTKATLMSDLLSGHVRAPA